MPAPQSLRIPLRAPWLKMLALLLGLLGWPRAVAAQALGAYEAAMSLASRASTAAEQDAAILALTALLPAYPQDVDLPLELGRLAYQRERYPDALRAYELARERSAPGGDADLGIGWTQLKRGRCTEATAAFRAVLAAKPADRSPKEGLSLCATGTAPASMQTAPSRLWLAPLFAQSFYIYRDHPLIRFGVAPTARLDALFRGRYYGAIAYRYTYFAPQNDRAAGWNQHDLYLDLGITSKVAGATLHYALVSDGSDYAGTSHHVGLTGRYSFYGDLFLNLAASFFSDNPVLRGELSIRIPVVAGFGLRPAGALQWTPGALYKTASLTLFYDHSRVSLWLGGKLGEEMRAAYLNVGYVYIGPQHIPYGVWAGASVRPGARFTLALTYTYDRLVRSETMTMPPEDGTVHSLTASLSREF